MMRKIAILLTASVLILLVEVLFLHGFWEPLSTPLSHAGTSVRLNRNLCDPNFSQIDFIAIGSSRLEYGIDHERESVSAIAYAHGYVHANLSIPGSQWMTIGVMIDWLRQNHLDDRGGIIALSAESLSRPGNGSYELGIVQPFRNTTEDALIAMAEASRHFSHANPTDLAQWPKWLRLATADTGQVIE